MEILKTYDLEVKVSTVEQKISEIKSTVKKNESVEDYKSILNLIDLTTLSELDNEPKIEGMCVKVNGFYDHFDTLKNVAAICIYPAMVSFVKKHLADKGVRIAAVGGGFPASQTFLEVKKLECKMAVDAGADEIDIVIPVGRYQIGNDELVFSEVSEIKRAISPAHLKVILETGDLTPNQIRKAALISMEAGADFVKTSTGKVAVSATHQAVYIMCEAIKDYHEKTGKKIGIKPAGGISEAEDALVYYNIVKTVLGDEWLNNNLFRIGASRLANNLLIKINQMENKPVVKYF